MFAGELQRQKALFAACDGLALLVAFAAALMLHDPRAQWRDECWIAIRLFCAST
jgi:hypothetical protein